MTTIDELEAAIHPTAEPEADGGVPTELIFQGYEQEIRVLTRRVIAAEAQVAVLQQRALENRQAATAGTA